MNRHVLFLLMFSLLTMAFQNCSSPGFSEEGDEVVSEAQTELPSAQPGGGVLDPVTPVLPVSPLPEAPSPRFSSCSAAAIAKTAGPGTPVPDATLLRDLRGTHDLEVLADHQFAATGSDLAFFVYANGARIGQSTDYYTAFTSYVMPKIAAAKSACVVIVERDDGGATGVGHKDRLPIECVMEENSSVYGKRITVVPASGSSGISAILCMTGAGASTADVTATLFKNSHALFAIIPR